MASTMVSLTKAGAMANATIATSPARVTALRRRIGVATPSAQAIGTVAVASRLDHFGSAHELSGMGQRNLPRPHLCDFGHQPSGPCFEHHIERRINHPADA